jgi:hypothetical protein
MIFSVLEERFSVQGEILLFHGHSSQLHFLISSDTNIINGHMLFALLIDCLMLTSLNENFIVSTQLRFNRKDEIVVDISQRNVIRRALEIVFDKERNLRD